MANEMVRAAVASLLEQEEYMLDNLRNNEL